ncbi:MAG TPA: hypothetical protein VM324_00305 [Egibacteraceae bacterium]|jgi:hypothetical protein|nr:hypothetical protein [Egibacteraceae bacterium]
MNPVRATARTLSTVVLVLALLLAALAGPVAAGARSDNVFFRFSDGQAVSSSAASLVTNAAGATMSLRTAELDRGAYTIWWVVFNHPQHCTDPFDPAFECGPGDLFASGVDASVLYAAGNVVGGSGRAGFGARLRTGDDSEALFGPGLTNPTQAEIHAVVRTHGPLIPGMVEEQIHTFNGGCHPGQPNEGQCQDLQFTAFRQRAGT